MSRAVSPALDRFLLNIIDRVPGTPANYLMEDLYTFVLGNGYIVVRQYWKPTGNTVSISAPLVDNQSGVFLHDIDVCEASDYTPVLPAPGPGILAHQYTVNNASGVYNFADSNAKLISYAFYIGPVRPQIMFWTSGQLPISWSGNVYGAAGPFFKRSNIKTRIGLDVASLEMRIAASPEIDFPGTMVLLLQSIVQGYFDGAQVLVERLVMPTYGSNSLGVMVWFKGEVGNIKEVGRAHASFDVNSRLQLLNTPLPRNIIQPACRHVLYGAGCTLRQSDFTFVSTVQSGSNVSQIISTVTQPGSELTGPNFTPTLSICVPKQGVNLVERNVFAVATYVNSLGESLPSKEAIATFGVVTSVFPLQAGAGYTNVPGVHISGGGGTGATATATVANGQVVGIKLNKIGSGYTSAPSVTIDAPPGPGIQATAAASIQGVPGNALVVVQSPPTGPIGTIGWNCYMGVASGDEMLQNSSPILIGQNWTEGVGAAVSCSSIPGSSGATTGSPPPILATNGFFSQGIVYFLSGPNAGLQRLITTHLNGGVLNIIPPLPFPPQPGDQIAVVAGCDKRMPTCSEKFNNLIHFGGMPYMPDPSMAV